MIEKIVKKTTEKLISFPKSTLLIGLILVGLLIPGLLKIKADFSHRGFFRADNHLIQLFDKFEETFSGDDRIALIVHSKDGIFDLESANLVKTLTEKLWEVKDIIRVDSLTNYNYTRSQDDEILVDPFFTQFDKEGEEMETLTQEFLDSRKKIALQDEILPGYLISKDAKTSMMLGRFKPSLGKQVNYGPAINQIRELVKDFTKDGKHEIYISGNAMVNQSFKEVSGKDTKVMIPLLIGTIFLLLFVVFRSLIGVVLPTAVILLSIITTFGVAGYIGVQYNSIISAVPVILITIAIADTIHLLMSYYQCLLKVKDNKTACRMAFEKNLFATFLTSFSTAVGFISLSNSELLPIAGMGKLGAAGSILAWLLTFLIVAPILVMQKPNAEKLDAKTTNKKVALPKELITNYLTFIESHSAKIFFGFVLLCGVMIYTGSQNRISSDPMKYLAEDVPFRVATDFMDENIGGASGPEVVITTDKADGVKSPEFVNKVDQLTTWMAARPGYSKVVSYIDVIKKMNRALNNMDEKKYSIPETQEAIAQLIFLYGMSLPQGMNLNDQIALDNKSIRISGFWILHESNEVLGEIKLIEDKIKELGLSGHVTGKMPIYQNMNGYVVQTFFKSILSALFFIALMMIIIFKSIKVGILSMIPNITPLFFGLAAMSLLNRPLDIGTVITGAICLGVAVDDTIHMLTHFMENRHKGHSTKESLEIVINETGMALMGTTFILVAGFLTFLMASFVPNNNLGISTAIILGAAVLIDLIIVPALLFLTEGKKSAI